MSAPTSRLILILFTIHVGNWLATEVKPLLQPIVPDVYLSPRATPATIEETGDGVEVLLYPESNRKIKPGSPTWNRDDLGALSASRRVLIDGEPQMDPDRLLTREGQCEELVDQSAQAHHDELGSSCRSPRTLQGMRTGGSPAMIVQ